MLICSDPSWCNSSSFFVEEHSRKRNPRQILMILLTSNGMNQKLSGSMCPVMKASSTPRTINELPIHFMSFCSDSCSFISEFFVDCKNTIFYCVNRLKFLIFARIYRNLMG